MSISNRKKYIAAAFGLGILFFLGNLFWIIKDRTPLLYDSYWNFLFSMKLFQGIKSGNLSEIHRIISYYRIPFLIPLITAPFYFISGINQDMAVIAGSTLTIGILIFSLFKLGEEISGYRAGFWSVFVFLMYPLVFTQQRTFMMDLPLTAFISLSIYLLIKSAEVHNASSPAETSLSPDFTPGAVQPRSGDFSKLRFSLLFAVVFILGLLIKINFILFVVPPLLWMGIKRWKEWKLRNKLILLILLLAGIFFFIFFFISTEESGKAWMSFIKGGMLGKEYWIYLVKNTFLMVSEGTSFFFALVFLIAFLFYRRIPLKHRDILALWFLPSLFILTLFRVDRRIFLPLLPVLALVSGAGIANLKNAKLRGFVLSLIILVGSIQYFAISFGIDFLPLSVTVNEYPVEKSEKMPFTHGLLHLTLFTQIVNIPPNPFQFSHPSPYDWKGQEIFELIKNQGKENSKVVILSKRKELWMLVHYYSSRQDFPLEIWSLDGSPLLYEIKGWEKNGEQEISLRENFLPLFENADFIIREISQEEKVEKFPNQYARDGNSTRDRRKPEE